MNNHNKPIIVISSYDDLKNPVYAGGGAYSVHQLAKGLSAEYSIIVLTGTYKNAIDRTIDKIHYVRIGSAIFGHKIGQLIYQLAVLFKAKTLKYDYWIESTTPPFTFSILALISNKPVIAWINMLSASDMQRKYFLNFTIIERFLARFYTYFVVPTDWVKKEVKAMNPKAQILRINCGFEYSLSLCHSGGRRPIESHNWDAIASIKSKLQHDSKKPYLLYIGRIEVNQKGLDLLINAIAKTDKEINLIIAGNGETNEILKLRTLISYLGLNNRVEFVGQVDGAKKVDLFKHAFATIIPSRFETFCIVALESIFYQKYIIRFDIKQLSWIPDKFSYKVKAFDVKQLAKIINVCAKTNKRLRKDESARFLKDYSWLKASDGFNNLIKQINL
jgi:phosphatidyl-myo-inositol alpha-mannosyltransferase